MRNKKLEKTHAKKKKTITRTRQYLRGSPICLRPRSCRDFTIIKKKNTKCGNTVFLLSKTTTTNPNHKNCVFYILCTRFTMGYKTGQKNYPGDIAPKLPRGLSMSDIAWAYRPKPSLHELNLKKSSIKNHTTLFGSSTGLNITRLHKAQQITHLETSSITNINRNRPKNNPSSLQLILLSTS